MTSDAAVLLPFVRGSGADRLRLVGRPFTRERWGVAMRREDTALCEYVSDALADMVETGAWKRAVTDNLGPARSAVAKGQPLVVAEGYMDVIALVRAGIEGAVAPLGTAITEEQLRLMWRVSPEPVIALDGDEVVGKGYALPLRLDPDADDGILDDAGRGLVAGHHPIHGGQGWRAWTTMRILDEARTWLFPLYSSTLTPNWLRALGATRRALRLGRLGLRPGAHLHHRHRSLAQVAHVGHRQARRAQCLGLGHALLSRPALFQALVALPRTRMRRAVLYWARQHRLSPVRACLEKAPVPH